ncbi:MAG: SDR family NAD(P)-dependent oxidoreductase [Candidatus Latescibacteria bacterium]|nr:SDR family NAD(P)-dependent oxidoreductase [Candidatus Latescibacterota bacterium]
MSVLITGGYGFIGSWVARQVADQGEDVIIYDIAEQTYDYLQEVADRITFVQGSVLDYPHLAEAVRQAPQLSGIVHSVALFGGDIADNPHHSMQVNALGTLNVLEAARQVGGVRLVYVSSGAVYGQAPGPLREDMPSRPSDPYGATKVASEEFCFQYAQAFGVDALAARLFFVYGPPERPGPDAGFNTTLFAPLAGVEKAQWPRGMDQQGDWTYVEDAARGIILMLRAQGLTERAFNIATGIFHPVGDIMAAVERHAPGAAQFDIGPGANLQRGAPLEIGRARAQLGYEPQFDLDEGVGRYATWLARQE